MICFMVSLKHFWGSLGNSRNVSWTVFVWHSRKELSVFFFPSSSSLEQVCWQDKQTSVICLFGVQISKSVPGLLRSEVIIMKYQTQSGQRSEPRRPTNKYVCLIIKPKKKEKKQTRSHPPYYVLKWPRLISWILTWPMLFFETCVLVLDCPLLDAQLHCNTW